MKVRPMTLARMMARSTRSMERAKIVRLQCETRAHRQPRTPGEILSVARRPVKPAGGRGGKFVVAAFMRLAEGGAKAQANGIRAGAPRIVSPFPALPPSRLKPATTNGAQSERGRGANEPSYRRPISLWTTAASTVKDFVPKFFAVSPSLTRYSNTLIGLIPSVWLIR